MLILFAIGIGLGHGIGWIKKRRELNRKLREEIDDDMGAI